MNHATNRTQTWLHRFAARGGFTLTLTFVAAVFMVPRVRAWWHLDWFYTTIVAGFLSLLIGHIFLLPLLIVALRFLVPSFFCEVCPVCSERALALGMLISEPTTDPQLHRVYQLAHCRRCHRRFHRLSDGTYSEQTHE